MKMPIFILMLLSAETAFAQADSFFASMKSTFSKGADPEVVLGIALGSLFLIGLLVLNEIRKADARERIRAKISWDAFYAKSVALVLSKEEIKVLESMVVEGHVNNADSLLTSAQVFENARESFYESKGGVQTISDETLKSFRALRSRLGFSPLPVETPYVSTRQFIPGLRVIVEMAELNIASNAVIEDVDERLWSIVNPFEGKGEIRVGMRVRLALTRGGDAEYGIDTEIEDIHGRSLVLRHTRRLTRRQLRNWVRVDVNLPAVSYPIYLDESGKPRPPVPVNGRIVDLSGGGLAIRLPIQLQVSGRMLIDFQLGDLNVKGMEAEIIRVAPLQNTDEPQFQHSVSFKDIQKPTQERIVRFVFEKQRQEAQWR